MNFFEAEAVSNEYTKDTGSQSEVHVENTNVGNIAFVDCCVVQTSSYQEGECTEGEHEAQQSNTSSWVVAVVSSMGNGCFFSTQEVRDDQTHDTSEKENSHAESAVVDFESEEELIVDFIEPWSQESDEESF